MINSRAISAEDDPRERHLRNLVSSAGSYGLTPSESASILRRVGVQVASWRDVAHEMGIPVTQQELMARAFDEEQLDLAVNASAV